MNWFGFDLSEQIGSHLECKYWPLLPNVQSVFMQNTRMKDEDSVRWTVRFHCDGPIQDGLSESVRPCSTKLRRVLYPASRMKNAFRRLRRVWKQRPDGLASATVAIHVLTSNTASHSRVGKAGRASSLEKLPHPEGAACTRACPGTFFLFAPSCQPQLEAAGLTWGWDAASPPCPGCSEVRWRFGLWLWSRGKSVKTALKVLNY